VTNTRVAAPRFSASCLTSFSSAFRTASCFGDVFLGRNEDRIYEQIGVTFSFLQDYSF
jgi:hypothetical protein